ncbi:MAG: hypothetical protein IH608_12755 [Proteobacteria bacterium]|nr:hypothetical protein [Pseudomonadota bacterium]
MTRWLAVWSAAFLLPVSVALADGEGPQRKPTPAEAQTLSKLWTTIEQSLPPAPANYIEQFTGPAASLEAFTLPQSMPPDGMLRMAFQKVFTLDPSVVQQTFADRSQGTPEQQARLATLDAKLSELVDARDRSRDPAEKKRLRAQIQETEAEGDALRETILSEYQEWIASGGLMAAMKEAQKVQASNGLVIRVAVNADAFILEKADNIGIPAANGLQRVYEEEQDCDGSAESYCYTIFLGPFGQGDLINGRYHYTLPKSARGVPTQARGMVITVSGTKDVREATALLQATDLGRLDSML